MEYEKYNPQSNYQKGKIFFNRNFFIFLSFLVVIGIIFLTTYYNGFAITGDFIKSTNQNNSIKIKTSIYVSELNLDGEYEEIAFIVKKGSFIYLDNKKISPDGLENKIVIKDFKGDILINKSMISNFEGKVSQININNVPINLQSGGRLKFSLSSDAIYNLFEIKENIKLKDISFVTSGSVDFGGDFLNLNSEKIKFINYLGSLKIENEKLILNGYVESLKIDSESRKIILSNN
jgi:hypothetical protein